MSQERRLILWLLVFAALATFIYILRGALLPFVAGMAVAYLLDPVADWMERRGVPRSIASLLIVLVFILVLAIILVVLVPILIDQVTDLVARAPAYIDRLRREAMPILRKIRASLTPGQAAQIDEAIRSHAGDVIGWIGTIVSSIVSGGAALLGILGLVFIMPFVAFYMIRDWDRLIAYIDSLLPRRGGDTIRALAREIDDRLSGFVRGQALVCLLLGAWYATGLTLVGLDFGILLGVTAGILSIIPYLGNIVGLGTSLLLAVAQFDSWTRVVLVAAVFVSGQVMEGNFVTPKIVGDRIGLHPIWLLFAVTAGGALLGITGALLAVPVAAALGVLIRYAVQRYRESPLYAEPEAGEKAVRPVDSVKGR
jgi:predicted PurR-regulated permease PerM